MPPKDNYKIWAIKQRMHELITAIAQFPESQFKAEREKELDNLKKDLDGDLH